MLVLERGYRQSIVIGDDVVITVLGVEGSQVRIGINAPAELSVDREEIWLRKQQPEKHQA